MNSSTRKNEGRVMLCFRRKRVDLDLEDLWCPEKSDVPWLPGKMNYKIYEGYKMKLCNLYIIYIFLQKTFYVPIVASF